MTTITEDQSAASGWRLLLGTLAVATAAVGAILSVTPPVTSTSDSEPACPVEVTATGPLLRMCELGRVR